jgi:prophage regulatory protein
MVKNTSSENNKSIRMLRWPEVQKKVGFSKSHAYALQAKGLFPMPIKLIEGGRANGYIEAEIDAYIEKRISISRGDCNE